MSWRDVRLSNCTPAAPTSQLTALPICVAPSIHLTIVARRARSRCIALLASFSFDLRFEKDDRRETNVPIREGLISGLPMAQITPSATGWLKNASTGTKFPSFHPRPRPQAVFRTHSACQVRSNRLRTMNRLASAQVTNSRCAFLSNPR